MGGHAVVLTVVLALLPAAASTGLDASAGRAAELPAVAAFIRRVNAYYTLRRRLEGPVTTLTSSADPAKIRRAVDGLGGSVRAARRGAHEGDIFAADVVPLFRHWIRVQCQNNFAKVQETTGDELEPAPIPRPMVNARLSGETSDSMAPDPLCSFPPLPDGLEYRFVQRDLVLWDTHADLVVDVIRDAIPKGALESLILDPQSCILNPVS